MPVYTSVFSYLSKLGLSEIESKLYIGLLELGSTTVMDLANHVGIKRITAHFNIENLIKRGLVSETRKGARRQIVAEDPERLGMLVEEKEVEVRELKEDLVGIIQGVLKQIPSKSIHSEAEIRYYEGRKAVLMVYSESMKADSFHSFTDLEQYYKIFPETESAWSMAFELNPKREVWDLVIHSMKAEEIMKKGLPRYHVRFLPKSEYFGKFSFSDYIIYDDMVAIIDLDSTNPSAMVIHSERIALSLKALHMSMWSLIPIAK